MVVPLLALGFGIQNVTSAHFDHLLRNSVCLIQPEATQYSKYVDFVNPCLRYYLRIGGAFDQADDIPFVFCLFVSFRLKMWSILHLSISAHGTCLPKVDGDKDSDYRFSVHVIAPFSVGCKSQLFILNFHASIVKCRQQHLNVNLNYGKHIFCTKLHISIARKKTEMKVQMHELQSKACRTKFVNKISTQRTTKYWMSQKTPNRE